MISGLLGLPRNRVSDVESGDGCAIVAVYYAYWVSSAFNILEELEDKNSAVVGPHDHARKVAGGIEGLLGDALVAVKEAVLVLAEVILAYEGVQAQNAVWV